MIRIPLQFHIVFLALLIPAFSRADEVVPEGLDRAVGRGLDFLAAHQNPDGSFGATQKSAVTGLALMSFLASGHAPSAGKFDTRYGSNVRAAIDYLLDQSQPDGFIGHNDKQMYGQAIATLALAEAYGVDGSEPQRKRMAATLTNSTKLIITAQEVHKEDVYAGGWRYEPTANDSDLSLSGWNALALRACQDAGIAVPRQAVQRAAKFVFTCYNPDGKGFAYQPGKAVQPGTTGVGLLCLHLLDRGAHGLEVRAATATLAAKPIDESSQYQYYGMYYASQAAFQSGDAVWRDVSKVTFDKLIKAQQPSDGGWPDAPGESAGTGRLYTTSMAVLTLSIPYCLLPIYQR